MQSKSTSIAYRQTGFYSTLILDYLDAKEELSAFYAHAVSIEGIKEAIKERSAYQTNRKLLVDTFQKHYAAHQPTDKQLLNIQQLNNANCFTVTTAHQPNIFTGHLYFIYKILHIIKLCKILKAEMPGNDFVPVFFMGSEDADLDELNHVYINGHKHEWKTNQTGAVGRMLVDKALIGLLDEITGEISIHPHGHAIIDKMKACYTLGATIEQATFKLVNNLFGDLGLLVLLPDNADYKTAFAPVVEKELKEQFSHHLVEETVAAFPKAYKVQAGGRNLNMFYLVENSRERIEKRNERFEILNSGLSFTQPELLAELRNHPERFSPNVILRPVLQEMLLPNIAFIGGGGEVAYWLELKKVFAALQVPFPVLVLRNSFLLLEEKHTAKVGELGFSLADLFKKEQELLTELVRKNTQVQLSLSKEKEALQQFYHSLKTTAGHVDVTLQPHTEALEKQALHKLEALEKKMLRAEKRKFEAQQRQLHKLKTQLFPHNNLQERIENFMPFYAKWGQQFFSFLLENSKGLNQEFVILKLPEE